MKILVLAANDSDNIMIANVLFELERRGHELRIFSKYTDTKTVRMFNGLAAQIFPKKTLAEKDFDWADCILSALRAHIELPDDKIFFKKYIFVYNNYMDSHWHTPGADFMFTTGYTRNPPHKEDCAFMAVGCPKNDHIQNLAEAADAKTLLFIDSGHYPFGSKGKHQVAKMLLDICRTYSDYKLMVKPRFLPGDVNMLHANREHIYSILQELTNGDLPENLILPDRQTDMQEMLDQCHCAIVMASTAFVDAALRGKNLIIVKGIDSEDTWDLRNDVEWKKQYELRENTGCVVDYQNVLQYLPHGIKCSETYLDQLVAYRIGASRRIADVMEHIHDKFLSKGVFPQLKEYRYETYRAEMHADNKLDWQTLLQKRMKNIGINSFNRLLSITADIDCSPLFEAAENTYRQYPLTRKGSIDYLQYLQRVLNELIVKNAQAFQDDPINQSFLLQALFDLGHGNEILNLSPEKILCLGPYHYYLGMVYSQKKDTAVALKYFCSYLCEANHRPFRKYVHELDWALRQAYNYVFCNYDGENIAPEVFAGLYIALYEQRNPAVVSYGNLKRAHNMMPELAEQLAEIDQAKALKCLQLYAKYEYHYNIRERNNQINDLKRSIADFHSSKTYRWSQAVKWPIKKLKGGIRCLKEHGWKYTWNLGIEKIRKSVKKKIENKTFYKIWKIFQSKVWPGFQLYSDVIQKYGDEARLFLSAPTTGDGFILAHFYEAYISKKYPEVKAVFAVFGKGGKGIAEMFGINNIEPYSLNEFHQLYNLLMFDGKAKLSLESLHYHIIYRHTGILARLDGLHGFNLFTQEKAFLDVKDEECVSPRFIYDEKFIASLSSKHGLVKGKTVLLEPYAKSTRKLSASFWVALAQKLRELGWCVCTNSISEKETAVEGTHPIYIPYSYSVSFLEWAGVSIGVRSGFHDVTNEAECLKITLYFKGLRTFGGIEDSSKFWGIGNMYQQPNQHDLLYAPDDEEQLIDEIIQIILTHHNES